MTAGSANPQGPYTQPQLGDILDSLSGNSQGSKTSIQNNVVNVSTAFFSFVVAEFFAISASNAANAAKYEAFIRGFQKGLMWGADVQFRQLFEQGYILGYTNGFRDGYSQGYSAGWTAGYAVGYQAGQSTWMSTFQNIGNGLSGLLSDAGALGTLLNDAGTVGEAIASIF
jgi:hypothetical protein